MHFVLEQKYILKVQGLWVYMKCLITMKLTLLAIFFFALPSCHSGRQEYGSVQVLLESMYQYLLDRDEKGFLNCFKSDAENQKASAELYYSYILINDIKNRVDGILGEGAYKQALQHESVTVTHWAIELKPLDAWVGKVVFGENEVCVPLTNFIADYEVDQCLKVFKNGGGYLFCLYSSGEEDDELFAQDLDQSRLINRRLLKFAHAIETDDALSSGKVLEYYIKHVLGIDG